MAKVVKKKDISSNLADAANSIKNALGWKEPEVEAEVEPTEEEIEAKKKKEKTKPRKAFSDFAESYRKEIGQ